MPNAHPDGMTPVEAGVEDGVHWATCAAPMWGAVNGYALLPEGHPWRNLDLQSKDGEKGPDVHGGITYGPKVDGWIGFDFLHCGDVWPGQPHRYDGDVERTPDDVAVEARSLARQIAASVA